MNGFGKASMDWCSAAEAYLNTIFELKFKNATSLARDFVQHLTRKLFVTSKELRVSETYCSD